MPLKKLKTFLISYKLSLTLLLGLMFLLVVSAVLDTSPQAPYSQERIVTLTEDGFTPEQLTIPVGQTVKFITTRGKAFWPASNLHPTHELYSEFDPQRPIEPNDSWSFKFEKLGKWRYHDHLAPYYTGEVDVVRGGEAKVKSSSSSCQGISDKNLQYYCWEKQVTDALRLNGIDGAYEKLASFYSSDPDFSKRCHPVAHAIGAAAYRDLSLDKKFKVGKETTWCAFGFYHGFMEALLLAGEDIARMKALCTEANRQISGSEIGNQATFLACLHGIGHGAADPQDNPKVWGNERALIKEPLKVCEAVSKNDHDLFRCAGGVFNVLSIAYSYNQYKFSLNKNDPLWICNEQPTDVYKRACYGDMNVALAEYAKSDMSIATKFVEKIKDDAMAQFTMNSLAGAFVSFEPKKTDHTDRVNLCRRVQERLRLACIGGFASGLAEYGGPGKEYIEAFDFCKSSLLKDDERERCYQTALGYLRTLYSQEEFLRVCNKVEDKYRNRCYGLGNDG